MQVRSLVVNVISVGGFTVGTMMFSFGLSELNLMRDTLVRDVNTIDQLYTVPWGLPWFDLSGPYTKFIPIQNAWDLMCFMIGGGVLLVALSAYLLGSRRFLRLVRRKIFKR